MANRTRITSGVLVELHVDDFDKVRDFYGRFGFDAAWQQTRQEDDGYLVMSLNDQVLTFWPGTNAWERHPYFSRFPNDTKRGFGVEIVIYVDDIGFAYNIANELGCVVEKLAKQPWGLSDFRVEDPFGYYIRFSEPDDILDPASSRV